MKTLLISAAAVAAAAIIAPAPASAQIGIGIPGFGVQIGGGPYYGGGGYSGWGYGGSPYHGGYAFPTMTAIAHMTMTNRWSCSAASMGTTTSRSSDVGSIASGL